jgi:hypothetical protein
MASDEELPMSESPDYWGDCDYEESDHVCPKCENVRMWQEQWFDDPIDMGGACIGTIYTCGTCNHYETH